MITIYEYVGVHANSPDWNSDRQLNAQKLLDICALLETELIAAGIEFPINPKTNSGVSGETNGGFREQNCIVGAPNSSHKEGQAVDRYDPENKIDAYLMANQDLLVKYGIYIESPDSTPSWSHWSTRAPGSGHHVFIP